MISDTHTGKESEAMQQHDEHSRTNRAQNSGSQTAQNGPISPSFYLHQQGSSARSDHCNNSGTARQCNMPSLKSITHQLRAGGSNFVVREQRKNRCFVCEGNSLDNELFAHIALAHQHLPPLPSQMRNLWTNKAQRSDQRQWVPHATGCCA